MRRAEFIQTIVRQVVQSWTSSSTNPRELVGEAVALANEVEKVAPFEDQLELAHPQLAAILERVADDIERLERRSLQQETVNRLVAETIAKIEARIGAPLASIDLEGDP